MTRLCGVVSVAAVASTLASGLAEAARREVAVSFYGLTVDLCPKPATRALRQRDGILNVTYSPDTFYVFVEFDSERVKVADVRRFAETPDCFARIKPYHVRAHGSEIRIGIGDDDAYINKDARLGANLRAPEGVSLVRKVLERKHATHVNDAERATFATFTVEAKAARRRGKHRVRARVVFFYCDETICEKRVATVWPIVAAPKR